ncbi:hypothetical protein BH10ACT3_BH10ACT3_00990 [soil metagenome]
MLRNRLLLVGALLILGLAASGIAWSRANDTAHDAETAAAEVVTEGVRSTAETAVAGLSGAAGLVPPSGPVSPVSFEAFRRDVTAASSLEILAYVPTVPGDERQAFESDLGTPIKDLAADSLAVAPDRDLYWPVRIISPQDDMTSFLLGFDIAASDFTIDAANAAVDSGPTTVTETVSLGADVPPLFFIIKPLYRPDLPTADQAERRAAHVGFVASAYSGDALAKGMRADLPPDVSFSILDGDVPLATTAPAPGEDAVSRSVDVGGRTWTVLVEDDRGGNHELSWFLLAITLVLVTASLYLVMRGARHDRAMDRVARLVGLTADLAQHLAGAATVDEVAQVIETHVAPVFDAREVNFALVDAAASSGDGAVGEAVRGAALVTSSPPRAPSVAVLPIDSHEGQVMAVVEVQWAGRIDFDDTTVATLRTVAELCEQTLQRAGVTDRVVARAAQLAQLAEELAGAATLVEVAAAITDAGRQPVGAGAASLGIIDRAAGVLTVLHGDSVSDSVSTRFASPALEERLTFTDAARTGEAVLISDWAEYRTRYPDAADEVAELGRGARAALPLRASEGTIGAVVFAWATPQRFDDELISTLTTIADTATQAVVRARLTEGQLADARHSRDLADFAQRVAPVRTAQELARVVIEHGATPVGATIANIGLVDEDEQRLAVQAHPYFDPELVQQFGERSLDDDLPGLTAIRTGEPVLMSTADEIQERYPGRFAAATETYQLSSTAHLPLIGADGSALGSVGFAWADPQQFSPAILATLRTLAELCSQTLERVRLGEAEHHLVADLQHRVVTPLPPFPGLSLAQRYRPAARDIGMGGDWYEGIELDDHRYAVVVGDIAGHGIAAVADMIQVRAVIAALVRGGVALGDIFPQATMLLGDTSETVTATAGLMLIDTAAATVTYVLAGHPPPAVRAPDGVVSFIGEGRQALLGLPIARVEPGVVAFPPGSTLFAYTDGLIERRRESLDLSTDRLGGVIDRAVGDDPELLADEVLDRSLDGQDPEDDVALVVIHHNRA